MLWMNPKSHSFTQLSIFLNAPAKPAVYALHTANRCIYVGETENLRQSLYEHSRGDSPWITVWDPTNFCFELWPEASRTQRKNQLIRELKPAIRDWDVSDDDLPLQDALHLASYADDRN